MNFNYVQLISVERVMKASHLKFNDDAVWSSNFHSYDDDGGYRAYDELQFFQFLSRG